MIFVRHIVSIAYSRMSYSSDLNTHAVILGKTASVRRQIFTYKSYGRGGNSRFDKVVDITGHFSESPVPLLEPNRH